MDELFCQPDLIPNYVYAGLVFDSSRRSHLMLCLRPGPGNMGMVYTGHRVGPREPLANWGEMKRVMSRQVKIDSGVTVDPDKWVFIVGSLLPTDPPTRIMYLAATADLTKNQPKNLNPTQCTVSVEDGNYLPRNIASTVQWVIPFILDPMIPKGAQFPDEAEMR